MKINEIINEEREEPISVKKQKVHRDGIVLNVSGDGVSVDIRAIVDGIQVGYVVFDRDGNTLIPDDLSVDEKYQGRGIAKTMYDYVKSLGFRLMASSDQTEAGKGFWKKHRGEERVWEDSDKYQPPELEVGDEILKGKFKNSPAKIKGFAKDKHAQPVLKTNKGDVQLFKPRITKLMPKKNTDKQKHYL